MGFASITFIFTTEIFHLQKIGAKFVSIKAETESVNYWKTKVLPMFYENAILSFGLLVFVWNIRPIWKAIRSEYLFAYLFFNIHQIIIKLPSQLYQHYYNDVPTHFYTGSNGRFFKDLILKYIFNCIAYTLFIIPSVTIGNRFAQPTTQKIMIEDNQDADLDAEPKLDNLADVDLQELEEIEPDPEEPIDPTKSAFQKSPTWMYIGGILIAIYIIGYIFYPLYYRIFIPLENSAAYVDQHKLQTQFTNFTFMLSDKRNENILVSTNEVDNFYRLELLGTFFPKKVISGTILRKAAPEELRAAAVFLDNLYENRANIVIFFVGLFKPILFALLYKVVDSAGIKEFHIRNGKTISPTLLVVFGFYWTVMIFAEPLLAYLPRSFQQSADCKAARSGLPVMVLISRIERANFATLTHDPVFSLVFVKSASADERFANIDLCLKSAKPKLM